MKTKVIQISSTSPSFFLSSGKGEILDILRDDWFAQIAKQLKKSRPSLDIECWSLEKSISKAKEVSFEGITFRMFPSNIAIRPGMDLSISMALALKKEAEGAEIENKKLVLHFHEYHSWQVYLILLLLKRHKNVKIIAQHHGGRGPFENLKKYKRLLLYLPVILTMQIMENFLFSKIDLFYTLSDNEQRYIKKKAPKSEIRFQTMGIGDEYFKRGDKQKARKKLGLKFDRKYLLFLGRVKTTKGIRELLEALKESSDVELLLVGGGQDSDKYKKFVEENKMDNVTFVGPVYGEGKMDYLDACDYLILPSHTEGAPVVLMEAIAKNIPVIATDVGGVSKMIKNGREGIIIKPNSKEEIVKAIKDIQKMKKKNISVYAEKYRWKNIVSSTLEDYDA